MLGNNFKIALHNELGLAFDYFNPHLINLILYEWLIVERSGPNGEKLTISDAGTAPTTRPPDAPDDLSPINSMFGILLYESADKNEATFLLVRHLPSGESVPGSFFPVDGCVSLVKDCGVIMRTAGRHAHDSDGNDIPNPTVGLGMAWHFKASKVNWANENFSRTIWEILICYWRAITFQVRQLPLFELQESKSKLTSVQKELIRRRIDIDLDS